MQTRVRIYQNYDKNHFRILLNDMHWNKYYNCNDVNIIWETMHDYIYGILEIMCPFQNIFVREDSPGTLVYQ